MKLFHKRTVSIKRTYSRVPNKRGATLINFGKIFQGLRSYLEGIRLLILTKYLFYLISTLKIVKKFANITEIILF